MFNTPKPLVYNVAYFQPRLPLSATMGHSKTLVLNNCKKNIAIVHIGNIERKQKS